jgi:linoleoyl-CoA desaturase
MVFKTVFMFCLFTIPFVVIVLNIFPGYYNLLMWALMGFGMAGIGLSVMHDGNHGAYSGNSILNKLTGYGLNFVGGYDLCWRIQHNVLHHTYTNIIGMDEDVDAGIVLRFSDSQPLKAHHKFQHLYAWFLYGLMSISWIMSKDFIQVIKYNRKNLLKSQNITLKRALVNLSLWKLFYFSYIIVLPIFLTDNLGVNIGGFFLMHFIAGFFLTTVFLCAHIVDKTEFPLPNENGVIDKNWYVHQMETTANFSNTKSFFSWFIGGLNYQIEHHLFPTICHVHYYDLSKIVKSTAKEYNLPYHASNTFYKALTHHYHHLKLMGKLAS